MISNLTRNNQNTQLHARLERLDAEMMQRGAVPYQYLTASRDGRKYIICCLKERDFRFIATVSTGHKTKSLTLRAFGRTPSAAVTDVLRQLKWNLTQKPEVFQKMFPKMEVAK